MSDKKQIEFICACRDGNIKTVKAMMSDKQFDPSKHDATFRDSDNGDLLVPKYAWANTGIQCATINNHIEIVKLLLTDPRVSPVSSALDTPIETACNEGNIEIVKILLADIRTDSCKGSSNPLQSAVVNGYIEIVKLLLPKERGSYGISAAVRLAAIYGHIDILKLLLNEKRVRPTIDNNHAIRHAYDCGQFETAKILLADPRVREHKPTFNYYSEEWSEDIKNLYNLNRLYGKDVLKLSVEEMRVTAKISVELISKLRPIIEICEDCECEECEC